ncbi:hypothetical protein SGRA_1498 [Saprospira grandis str. Lewin]|uniref:Uncharacterized protein n=1 Tax=Saprospira grandis (strain Lewin) TaxID=984262 RepID=H6L961_SAPGL|nr:hypothetical protein SGRA_1498 [Saprospira grandis str. Lewin]
MPQFFILIFYCLLIFLGPPLRYACGATLRGSLFARPFAGFACSVWPTATPTHR